MKRVYAFIFFYIIGTSFLLSEEGRLLRFPNASKTQITFCHAGDIYIVPIEGGIARRLTSSEGIEMFPRFSPDGSKIAFSAEYDGNREIYIMPSNGGEPERLTYSMDISGLPERMGPDKIIMNWTSDGGKILFRSRDKSWNAWSGFLYTINIDGGLPEQLPLPRVGFCSYSPDGNKIAYNRVFREFRTWKRYRGGQADDIWVYDFRSKQLENITNNAAQDIIPMWTGNKIYFLSDRDHTMNLFVYDITTKQTKKVSNFFDYDVKYPSLGSTHIAFENGGYIYILDLATEAIKKVDIQIAEDFPDIRTKIFNVKDNIYQFEISPDGKRALFTARGDIFTVPAEKGNIRNLTNTPGIHDRAANWSPNGKWIAFISDRTGEDEIYIMKPDGKDIIQLTSNSESYRFDLLWSPDSKKILCSDKAMKLYWVDISSKKVTNITRSPIWEIRDYCWSPDSKWIAYTEYLDRTMPVVNLYSLENGSIHKITSEYFASYSPEFDPEGKYLWFVSDRTFNPQFVNFELNWSYTNMSKIYGLTLQDSLQSPFSFESDEVKISEEKSGSDNNVDKKEKKKSKNDKEVASESYIKIDIENLSSRIFELPIEAGAYGNLRAVKDGKIYYTRTSQGKETALFSYDIKKKNEKEIGKISSFEISGDYKKILFKSGKEYYIENLDESVKADKGKLNLEDLTVKLDKKQEWKQIFDECWRQMRDFLYDPNMHGVEWKLMRERYGSLLSHVHHRADLTYLISEMIAELNVGHAYVGGGDMPKVKSVPVGLLGADFEFDRNSGFYKIKKIFSGQNWDNSLRSPLTEPGINIKEGDYLVAIDGERLSYTNTPYKLLVGKSDKFIKISINSSPTIVGAKDYDVKTISSEQGLRYFDYVETNRMKVDKASNGRVGYIHIPDMGVNGLNYFVKYFYPQLNKEALIIDDRFNGGGFVSQTILERLRRELTMAGIARNQQIATTYPDAVMIGPMVCLLNELSASDGDIFPYNFKQSGLGKLIGKRSWGGVIGIRGSLPILDGGYLFKPEFGHFAVDGKWVLEGVGMEPDIVVDNHPDKEYNGIDEQLDKAIEVIMEELKSAKSKLPVPEPFPIKK